MKRLEEIIFKYGSQNDISNLQDLLYKTSEQELEKMIKSLLSNASFPRVWDFLLKAFHGSKKCQEKRIKLVLTCLNELEDREGFSSNLSSQLLQRLCMDLIKFTTEDLVEICSFCLKSIQSSKYNSNISWKDLLPDTLRILSEKDNVEYNELDYTGQEFKTAFINNLCMTNWCPGKVTQIAAMFSDMSLSKEEHLKVINKLTCYLQKLTPQEVPPFIYHLLRLCRHQNSCTMFLKLQQYFCLRIYNNSSFVRNNDSESTPDLDMIESAEDHEALDAEGMVLFHIQTSASISHSCIKDYLNSLKNAVRSPDFILNPFQLLVLLTISTVAQYEEIVFTIVRQAVVKSYQEQQKKMASYWYRDIISCASKPEDVFSQIMNLGNRDFLLEAFANFGFALLNVGSALGRDLIAEKQWTLGTMIVLKVIKKKRSIIPIVLKTFCNHILTRSSASQYIECLYFLNKTSPLLMLENQSCVIELMESLIQIPSHIANQLIEALTPLTKVSPTIRDQLILILRKCLYSRSIETRQVAVYGYIKLISTLQISNEGILSQTSNGSLSSGYSLYTQISLNRTTQSASNSNFSSEAICLEVLDILKRCFIQQYEVRLELYENLCNVVEINPELGVPILDVLWFHFMEYYVMDEDSNPPLNFANIALLRDVDCVLQEPLGNFIFTISQIVAVVSKSEDNKNNPTVVKYRNMLDALCNRMANCELVHFELDDGTDLTDILPESQKKQFILKEVIGIFEALMGYKFTMLSARNENQCTIINGLYQGYSRFLNFGKNLSKPKKTKKNEKATQKDKNQSTQKTQTQTCKKPDAGSKASPKTFKVPDTLLNLKVVEKSLSTLLESAVPWVTTNDANSIRTKTDLHRHFIQAASYLIGKCKNCKSIDNVYQKNNFDHICSIAKTLYNRIIKRLNDYVDFDCTAAVSSVECFHNILNLINNQYKNKIDIFLREIGQSTKDDNLINLLKPILEEFQKIFELDENELSNDPDVKRLSSAVLNNLSCLCGFIPNDSNVLSVQIYDWLKQIAYNQTISSKVAGSFMNLLCETHIRYKSGLILFDLASQNFKDVFGTANPQEESIRDTTESLKIVNIGTASSLLLSLCNYNKNILEDAESIIARMKSDYNILTFTGEEDIKGKEALKTKEKGVACQLCFMSKILTNLMSLALPPGTLPDAIFKNIVQFYCCLTSLTKYFISKHKSNQTFQAIWFEKLVKLTGKKLSPTVYVFIYQLQSDQVRENEPTQGGKKKTEGAAMKIKILRETKSIPKVVYEMEQFSKFIIQLSKKTKHDLSRYVGQGTSRDFRIIFQQLQEDLKRDNENATQETEAETSRDSERHSDGSEAETEEPEEMAPPIKKLKR